MSSSTEKAADRRQAAIKRMTQVHLASMGNTIADTMTNGVRQRLLWLGLLATPLLLPVTLPGMASAVGTLCLLVAFSLCADRSVPLPDWLARRSLGARMQALMARMVGRTIHILARLGRPRMLVLSNKPARFFNGIMLAVAGLSMVAPVPIISFDNVLPALAIVLLSWGLRLRDGLMLSVGYLATVAALVSVVLLWWGGAVVVTELLSWLSR